jgi:hypothetical protein
MAVGAGLSGCRTRKPPLGASLCIGALRFEPGLASNLRIEEREFEAGLEGN